MHLRDYNKTKRTRHCTWCGDNVIPGLPTTLIEDFVPHLVVVSLIGICPLCKAGCQVVFDNEKCDVMFKWKVILRGYKDPSTDLWTLLLNTEKMLSALLQLAPVIDCAPHSSALVSADIHPAINLASFTHLVCTWANSVNFLHQSLCNPKISTLLKAVHKGVPQEMPQSQQNFECKIS